MQPGGGAAGEQGLTHPTQHPRLCWEQLQRRERQRLPHRTRGGRRAGQRAGPHRLLHVRNRPKRLELRQDGLPGGNGLHRPAGGHGLVAVDGLLVSRVRGCCNRDCNRDSRSTPQLHQSVRPREGGGPGAYRRSAVRQPSRQAGGGECCNCGGGDEDLGTDPNPKLSESPRTHPCVTGRNRGECQYAAWRTPWGAWGACSNKCGSGTQSRSRTVTCVREDDQTVPARECTQKGITMPASTESQTCSDQSGCSYRWSPGAWGPYGRCSSTCGSGTQSRSRTVRCERSDGVGVADSFCSGQAKPEETESKACTDTSTCTYEWRTGLYGRWSDCSNDCGSGTQERTRPVTCTRSDGTAVSDSECRERKPESSERRICDSTRGWWVPLPSLPPPRPVFAFSWGEPRRPPVLTIRATQYVQVGDRELAEGPVLEPVRRWRRRADPHRDLQEERRQGGRGPLLPVPKARHSAGRPLPGRVEL